MRKSLLLVIFLCLCGYIFAQEEVPDLPTFPSPCNNNSIFPAFRNPSFEGLGLCLGPPVPWNNCGLTDVGNAPFPITSRGFCFNLNVTPSEGENYLVFTSEENNNRESGTGIVVNPAIVANQDYAFLIDLRKVDVNACMTFKVYGSNGCEDNEELLWQSPEIENTDDWQPYLVTFNTANNFRYITLRANSTCGRGQLLADNIRAYANTGDIDPVINATNTSLCGNETFIYTNPVADARYRWLLNGNEISVTNENFLEVNVAGNYEVEVLTACDDFLSNEITIQAGTPPAQPIITGDAVLCEDGEEISLFVQNPDNASTYFWYEENQANALAEGEVFNPMLPGRYRVETENGCGNTTSEFFEVTEGPSPITPRISGGVELCLNEEATLQVDNPQNGITYIWYQIGQASPVAEGPVLITSNGGAYYLLADNGCKTARSNTEFVVNIPEAVCDGTGTDCSDFRIPTLPFYDQPARGFFETRLSVNDYTGEDACNPDYFEGKEFIFSYTPTENECVKIQIGNPEQQPIGLFVTQQCEPFRECIASSLSENGSNPQLDGLQLEAGETYNFLIGSRVPVTNIPFLFSMESCDAGGECPNGVVLSPDWENPSFEDTPGINKAPNSWLISGIEGIENEISPDVQPFDVGLNASEGNSYLGVTAFPGGTRGDYQEGVAQALNTPLEAGREYLFLVDLANPASEPGEFRGCGGIEIWGGNDTDDFVELLWKSPVVVDNSAWQTFTVNFTPSANFSHIQILAGLYEGCNRDYVLVDNLQAQSNVLTPPEINTTANEICPGNFPELSVDEVPGAIYQWFLDDNPIGINSNMILAEEPGEYRVEVSLLCNKVESTPVTIELVDMPTDPVISGDAIICGTENAILSVENPAVNVVYAWYFNGTALGENGEEITVNAPGNYTVGVQYACGEILSEVFEVNFQAPTQVPNITGTSFFCEGNDGELRLLNPQAGVTYQWFFEGNPINGADGTRTAVTAQGNYEIEATGICEVQRSEAFTVTQAFIPETPTLIIENFECGSQFRRLTITNPQTDVDYVWVLNDTDTLQSGSINFLETNITGTYKVIATNNCQNSLSDNIELEITNEVVEEPIISGGTVVCEGTTIDLTIDNFNPAFTYQWVKDGQPIVSEDENVLTITEAGSYKVFLTTECEIGESNVLEVEVAGEALSLTINGEDFLCIGESTALEAVGVPTGLDVFWFREGENEALFTGSILEITEGGNYFFEVNTACGIERSESIEVNSIGETIQLSIEGDDSFCTGQSISLEAVGLPEGSSLTWFKEGENEAISTESILEIAEAGSYFYEVNTQCGVEQSELKTIIENVEVDIPQITGDSLICEGENTILGVTAKVGSDVSWTLDGVDLGKSTEEIVADVPGVYLATVTNQCGSETSSPFTLQVELLVTSITDDTTILFGEEIQLQATGGSTYTWLPATSLSDASLSNPFATPTETTTYTVLINSENGCEAQEQVTITIDNPEINLPYDIRIPNVFSPNNDGMNDNWEIAGISIDNTLEVSVYDRWGAKVFYTPEYIEPWDGTTNGRVLPVGTYFYVIQLANENKPITGHVSILK